MWERLEWTHTRTLTFYSYSILSLFFVREGLLRIVWMEELVRENGMTQECNYGERWFDTSEQVNSLLFCSPTFSKNRFKSVSLIVVVNWVSPEYSMFLFFFLQMFHTTKDKNNKRVYSATEDRNIRSIYSSNQNRVVWKMNRHQWKHH